ncbi:D-serine deaminase-like pyridoxal phosphate-dependent protein [Luteibacter rhizovicinus]|uniref:D-serine deaminase-like pyridoxal phosphate-dependent protein n=1 Tax=Luteibacter rhizovicinus TaxID=242606 RepID=A0A4R3YMH4_9GAMM|nr:alanine racemase [Luteibacter rhizovicinus]TCV93412.1 D-serine deaminase-like pyridoxal phosphate-dependent protein [Luteibacter rhizovicinus]
MTRDRSPAIHASPHDIYFNGLQNALNQAGIARPSVVIDRERMRRNAARLKVLIAPGTQLRLVEKSLPVPALLDELMKLTDTRSLMVFHEPQLRQVAQRFPDSDVLMGKPMPVLAARHFYQHLGHTSFDPARQLQWLIDTPARLQEYLELACGLGTKLRVNLEIDVGLHRGGASDPAALHVMLEQLRAAPEHLEFSGLMGYDAHVGKLPALVESRDTSFAKAVAAYRAFQATARACYPELAPGMCWNGAGSPTVALHRYDSPLNDVSAGSALLKPLEFDIDLLAEFEPAIFITTPVLKAQDGTRLPGPAWLSKLLFGGRARRARSYFIYGGGWPAQPASPVGLQPNKQFGLSFNQSILNGPREHALAVNDTVFFRPYQSEGSLLHYGPVHVIDNGRIVDAWMPFGET